MRENSKKPSNEALKKTTRRIRQGQVVMMMLQEWAPFSTREQVVLEHASSQEQFEAVMQEIDEAMGDALEAMRSSDSSSPRFRT